MPGTIDFRDRLKRHSTKVYKERLLDSISKIAIHHSLTETGSAEAFARYHVTTKGWPGIGYHFVIEKDGTVKWCHNLTVKSYHVGNSNRFAVGICLVGDFRKQSFDEVQKQALIKLVRYLLIELKLSKDDVWGHNEFEGYGTKECPSIDMDALRRTLEQEQSSQPDSKEKGQRHIYDILNFLRAYLLRWRERLTCLPPRQARDRHKKQKRYPLH